VTEGPKLYSELASWFHLVTDPADYAEEAELYRRLLVEACDPETVLELGSGGGNNASHLKRHFRLTLTDRSPDMLELSRSLNAECEHVLGDMRNLRLERVFDAVFVHDALAYLTSEGDLRAALETAYVHCRPGGAALFVPDHVRERFEEATRHGGHDGPTRALRYVEWTWDPDPMDTTYLTDFAYLLRDEDGGVHAIHDRHVCGLFERSTWLRLLAEVGFDAESHETPWQTPWGQELFVARKPAAA
jgi:SAM-dependent methyltransferase